MTDFPETKTRMTLEEFKALPETNQHMEFIDGELIPVAAPRDSHQKSVTRSAVFLGGILTTGEFRVAPTDVYFGKNCLQPDLFWVSLDNTRCVLGADECWYGAPDLVVEILSPSTAGFDRGRKYELYEEYGVREYWLVDTEARFVEVYTHDGQRFVRRGVFGRGQTFSSPVLSDRNIEVDAILGK